MAKTTKREDGLYQKNIVVGRNPDGSYIRKTIYAKTKKELDIKSSEITQQVFQGTYIVEDKTTFGDVAKLWLTQYNAAMSPAWAAKQESILRVHLLPMLGMAKLKDLKTYHLQDIINQMAQSGNSTSTMKKAKQTAARIMETALERDLIMRNVFSKVKVPSVEPKERRALTEDEKALLTASWQKHRMGLPAMIMMYCGLRRGEVLALRWNDIDLDNKVLHVNKSVNLFQNQPSIKKPKSKAGLRDVPIPNMLIDILKAAPHTYPIVCPDAKGCLMTDTAYRRAWNSYRSFLNSEAGGHPGRNHVMRKQVLDNITAHMLRHPYVKHKTKKYLDFYRKKSLVQRKVAA